MLSDKLVGSVLRKDSQTWEGCFIVESDLWAGVFEPSTHGHDYDLFRNAVLIRLAHVPDSELDHQVGAHRVKTRQSQTERRSFLSRATFPTTIHHPNDAFTKTSIHSSRSSHSVSLIAP